jgi:hypothetical protein
MSNRLLALLSMLAILLLAWPLPPLRYLALCLFVCCYIGLTRVK